MANKRDLKAWTEKVDLAICERRRAKRGAILIFPLYSKIWCFQRIGGLDIPGCITTTKEMMALLFDTPQHSICNYCMHLLHLDFADVV